jgi:hypothetical protein
MDHTLGPNFDHRAIWFNIKGPVNSKKGVKKLIVSNSILKDPDLDIVAWYSIFETYLMHLSLNNVTIADRDNTLLICGNVRQLLKDAGPDFSYYTVGLTEDIISQRNVSIEKIRKIMYNYPVGLLYNFELSIEDDIFFEILLNNFRNEITSYQSFVFKFKKKCFDETLEKIAQETFLGNYDNADVLEHKLSLINEQIIRDSLENSNLFETLNDEKMTPFFSN